MITILLPAYNEADIIRDVLNKIIDNINLDEQFEILVINDGSEDRTEEIANAFKKEHKEVRLISHKHNMGIGSALSTGIQNAKGRIIITMDADLTHPPNQIPKLVKELDNKKADVCIASRYVEGGGMKDVPHWRVLLSVIANRLFSLLFGTIIRDLTSGFKAYKTKLLRDISITKSGFEVQLEIVVKLLKKKARFIEIPLVLSNRKRGQSKFMLIKSMTRYLSTILELFYYRWFFKNPKSFSYAVNNSNSYVQRRPNHKRKHRETNIISKDE